MKIKYIFAEIIIFGALVAPSMGLCGNPPIIKTINVDKNNVDVFECVAFTVDMDSEYNNPFNSDEISIDAIVKSENNNIWKVPGFYFQEYSGKLVDNKEQINMVGEPKWVARISFPSPGIYKVIVKAKNPWGEDTSRSLDIEVRAADVSGMIRRSKTDHRYFVTDRGETYFPVGANICWGDGRGVFAYDDWLPKYSREGCNYFRVWLSPEWATFAMNSKESGYDKIDLYCAWRLDHLLDISVQQNMRVMLAIDSFNFLSYHYYGSIKGSVYMKFNGGILEEPLEYFTDERMKKIYKDRLRYIVARYGYSSAVMCWEFWNEVNLVADYDSDIITNWHREMAEYLKSIDPWDHLITTSHSGSEGDTQLDIIPELDFVQSHSYRSSDMAFDFGEHRKQKAAAADRPHFHGEFGCKSSGGKNVAKKDPTGIHLHNGLFSSVGQMQAGTPMTWWWDLYIDPENLYPIFGCFTKWIKGYDFVAQKTEPMDVQILDYNKEKIEFLDDLVLFPEKESWEPADSNKPVIVKVDFKGEVDEGEKLLSKIMHGLGNHPDLHNPVTFEFELIKESTFEVHIDKVSGWGGSNLLIYLDNELKKEFEFNDPDGMENTDALTDYKGVYSIPIPAGEHTVKVESTGKDWFEVESYRVEKYINTTEIPIRALGVVGETMALVWVQNKNHTWSKANRMFYKIKSVENAGLNIFGLSEGNWTIEHFNTYTGEVEDTWESNVKEHCFLTIDLPVIETDTAYRLIKK